MDHFQGLSGASPLKIVPFIFFEVSAANSVLPGSPKKRTEAQIPIDFMNSFRVKSLSIFTSMPPVLILSTEYNDRAAGYFYKYYS